MIKLMIKYVPRLSVGEMPSAQIASFDIGGKQVLLCEACGRRDRPCYIAALAHKENDRVVDYLYATVTDDYITAVEHYGELIAHTAGSLYLPSEEEEAAGW